MTLQLSIELLAVFIGLFLIGTAACLPLYKNNVRAFFGSKLWVKIYWWWPIFTVLLLILWLGWIAASVVCILLVLQAIREFHKQRGWRYGWVNAYMLLFVVCLAHLALTGYQLADLEAAKLLAAICFASVLSDVCAFFAGSYLGSHHLPAYINEKKSYEGVAGQIVSACVGLGLVSLLPELSFSWALALGVGVASAAGDLINSIAKRNLGIKDWGNAIPGHGGVLDRFSSLSFAVAAGYWIAVASAYLH